MVNSVRVIDAWLAADASHGWLPGIAAVVAARALSGVPAAATPGVRTVVNLFARWFSG